MFSVCYVHDPLTEDHFKFSWHRDIKKTVLFVPLQRYFASVPTIGVDINGSLMVPTGASGGSSAQTTKEQKKIMRCYTLIFWVSVTFHVCRSVILPAQKFSQFLLTKKEISMSCAIEL